MNYSGIINCSIVDGDGFRVALYVSGCKHGCNGCHNKETWDFKAGKEFTKEVEDILFDRLDKPYIKGLTLTGGDPLLNCDGILPILKRFRERYGNTKDVWLYTGFTIDEIMRSSDLKNKVVELCDYIVDGKFEIEQKDTTLAFRGSRNQKIWEKTSENVLTLSSFN